jgi:hypothetical protein|tara:strand:- start:1847 stop:1999 length:153 start_codon:yes stop_codon:yes gene_type:complete
MLDINTQLLIAALENEGVVEPCDDNNSHPLDWCEVTGVDLFDEIYLNAAQ